MDKVQPIIKNTVHISLYKLCIPLNTSNPISKGRSINLILTQNLQKSRYNHLSEPKWSHMAVEDEHISLHIDSKESTQCPPHKVSSTTAVLSSRQAILHRSSSRLIQNRLSSVFTADYIIEVGEITPLFMLPSRHYKCEACKLPAVYLIMQSVQDAHLLHQPASYMFQQLTAHGWQFTSGT